MSGGLKFLIREFGWARASRGSSWTSSWHTDEVVFGNLKACDKSTMTSTNMFQGLDTGSKPSSRWEKNGRALTSMTKPTNNVLFRSQSANQLSSLVIVPWQTKVFLQPHFRPQPLHVVPTFVSVCSCQIFGRPCSPFLVLAHLSAKN